MVIIFCGFIKNAYFCALNLKIMFLKYISFMKKLSLFLLVIFSCVNVNGQLLWRITGGNCYEPSYLFGTIHLETSRYMDSVPGLREAINEVDAIYGEVVKDEMLSKNAISQALKESLAPADSTIDKLIAPEEYHMVDKVVKEYMRGLVGLDQLKKFKPMTIVLQLEGMQMMKYFPDSKSLGGGLDLGIQTLGEELGKYVGGFESIEEQMKLAYGTTLREQARSLVQMCIHDKDFGKYNCELTAAYHRQDLSALEELLLDSNRGMGGESLERMCYARNRKWMKKIIATMPVQSMLIVVGAAHLIGDNGLIELLRNSGYVVEAVRD